jgi:hypothetical protein
LPWYRRAYRWGQTNIMGIDPTRCDIAWRRQHWKRTQVQGAIINAGGIVAYYPSKYPRHYRPPTLGDRDLHGELPGSLPLQRRSDAPGLLGPPARSGTICRYVF